MTGLTVLGAIVRPEKKYNLCEVCFKPFNLANIDMHLEAGCAAEIKERYKFISESTKLPKLSNRENHVQKVELKKIQKKTSAKKQTKKSKNLTK